MAMLLAMSITAYVYWDILKPLCSMVLSSLFYSTVAPPAAPRMRVMT